MTRFEIKPLKKTGGISLEITGRSGPVGFVYCEPDKNEESFKQIVEMLHKILDSAIKPSTILWVKTFSEPLKFRKRADRVIISVGRRKGYDGQLEDFSMDFKDFVRELCAGVRYGLNLLMADVPAGAMPEWIEKAATCYNQFARTTGQREYSHKRLTAGK